MTIGFENDKFEYTVDTPFGKGKITVIKIKDELEISFHHAIIQKKRKVFKSEIIEGLEGILKWLKTD